MRTLAVVALLIAAVAASPLPDDESVGKEHIEDWQLIPDAEGYMHLVDINNVDMEAEPLFNPWIDARMLLFTPNNPFVGQRIDLNNAGQLTGSQFNPSFPTRILVHGWNSDAGSGINTLITAAFLSRGWFNVFVLDWGIGANTINYIAARNRVDDVGLFCGQFVDFLSLVYHIQFSSVSIIGHSLGAHIAGICGKRVTRGTLNSVIALDPALPLFTFNDHGGRVHLTDAVYVEIIHTDIGRLGIDLPIGHASFYPNWGWGQTGCGIDIIGTCGHSRAWEFFAETVRIPGSFYGTRCSGWPAVSSINCPSVGPSVPMGGEPANVGVTGVFYMPTNGASPFGQGWRA